MPAAQQDLVDFLAKLKLSKAQKHLEVVDCCSMAALKALKPTDLKAMGFRPEVRSRLQKHIADESAGADYKEEEVFVTVDEEEEAIEMKASKAGKKKAPKKKPSAADAPTTGSKPVPGEGGEALEPGFEAFVMGIGLKNYIPKFQEKHVTAFESCKLMTKATLISTLGIPDALAGRIMGEVAGRGCISQRCPELHHDLSMVVNRMNISEEARQRVRARLAVNNVLSLQDAAGKRFAMMNEVGLTCDEATELGRLLDAAPVNGGMHSAREMGGWPGQMPNGYAGGIRY